MALATSPVSLALGLLPDEMRLVQRLSTFRQTDRQTDRQTEKNNGGTHHDLPALFIII